MSLSPQFLDELRARTSLSALIGRSVKLTKAGREWKACCPFHQEKTPSFTVNDDKAFYHCFGCQAHGDAISFLTDAKGLPFIDAVKELADAAGLEMPAQDRQAQQRAERASGLYEVMEAAASWFADQLAGVEGGAARAYLDRRGISDSARRAFRFGFAPDSRGRLKAALRDLGVDQLVEAGLLIQPDEDRDSYDRFRGRLMIPIRDQRGRVIAFGGRILGPGEPKYLNSPETPLFDKGRTLYNLDRAGPASRDARRVIVVEGYMDVIALDQAGFGEAVAPLGTAVTEGQLERLWRLAPTPIFCFDGDSAGQKAAIRAALRALPHVAPGRSLSFLTLPPGLDPDDFLRAKGRAALDTLLEAPEPLVDRLWAHELAAEPLATPEQKAGLRSRLLDHVATIGDSSVRDQYKSELLERYFQLTRPPRRRAADQPWTPGKPGGRGRFAPPRPVSAAARGVAAGGLDLQYARRVLRGLLAFPDLVAERAETLAALAFAEPAAARLRDILLDAATAHAALDPDTLNTILAQTGTAALVEELQLRHGLKFSSTRRNADPERARRDLVLVIDTLAARPGLDAALRAATARLEEDGDDAAFAEQQRLRAARDETDRRLAILIEGDAADQAI